MPRTTRRTTRIFCVSTLYGAATLAAALDAGLFEPTDRRLLLVTNNAVNPETTPSVDAMPGFARIRERFDEVLSWNTTISPSTPAPGVRAGTTSPCGSGTYGCCGTSATTRSTWRWSPSR